MLWFCCDGGLFNKHTDDDETESIVALYENLQITDLDADDTRLLQVNLVLLFVCFFIFLNWKLFFLPDFLFLCLEQKGERQG